MQAATGTLTAAIQSKDRTNVAVVKADWLRDGSFVCYPGTYSDVYNNVYSGVGDIGTLQTAGGAGWVESVTPNRSLSTDLPEASKSDAGSAAADATIVLAGQTLTGGVSLSKVFGAYNNGLSQWAPRIGTPVTIDLGLRGTAGVEVLRQFTGKVRGCSVDPASGNVTLTCLDRREAFRTPVSLPVVVRDDFGVIRPGFSAGWMLDWIARAQGFYTSAPQRAQCRLLATLHGSAWPEVGAIRTAYASSAGNLTGPMQFSAATTSGIVAWHAGTTGGLDYVVGSGLNVNQGSGLFWQTWAQITATGNSFIINNATPLGTSVQLAIEPSTSNMAVTVQRGGLTPVTTNIATTGLVVGTEQYVALHLAFTAAGANINLRVGSNTFTGTVVTGAPTGNVDFDRYNIGSTSDSLLRDMQITSEPFSSAMWDNAFVPTAVFEPSLNELTATPTVDSSDPWEICQQIASAEQGIFGFDENGVLRFYNRNHMTGGAAVATITTDPSVAFANLIQAASDEQVDGIANYVTVGAIPLALDPAGTALWALSELIGIPAGGSITLPIEFPGAQWTVSSTVYNANTVADGSGSAIVNLGLNYGLPMSATTRSLTITNPNAFPAYMVDTSGDPSLVISGQCIRPALESGYTSTAQDVASQTRYGYQSLDIPANPWMQSQDAANTLATALLAALKDPHPTLTGVEIVADYRLQLADRVRVKDPDGLYLDADFWVIASSPRFSASDTGQSVTLRAV